MYLHTRDHVQRLKGAGRDHEYEDARERGYGRICACVLAIDLGFVTTPRVCTYVLDFVSVCDNNYGIMGVFLS